MSEMNAETIEPTDTQVSESPVSMPSDGEAVNPWDTSSMVGEDGSIDGFKSLESLLKSAKDSQDYITKLNAEKQSTTAKADNDAKADATAIEKGAVHDELVKEIAANNGNMTDEINTKASEAGLDLARLELDGLKVSKSADKIYEMAGGKEQYLQMINDMSGDMTDESKAQFTKDLSGSQSEFTVRGMKDAWMEKTGKRQAPQRVDGQTNTTGTVKPYASQSDMLQDLKYLRTAGKNDTARQKEHLSRRAVTPNEVLFGR